MQKMNSMCYAIAPEERITPFDLQDAIKSLHWSISNIGNRVGLLPDQGSF